MSIDINWEAATSGPDGEALAERIRSFIHDKFQQIALPRFIRSVEVNSFDFGTIKPELQIKDLCDPFEDFYEEDEDNEIGDGEVSDIQDRSPKPRPSSAGNERSAADAWQAEHPAFLDDRLCGRIEPHDVPIPSKEDPLASRPIRSPMLLLHASRGNIRDTDASLLSPSRPVLPGLRDASVFGEPSNSQRPNPSGPARRQSEIDIDTGNSRPSTADTLDSLNIHGIPDPVLPRSSDDAHPNVLPRRDNSPAPRRVREKRPEDLQVLCRLRYNGNIRLSLTALVLLDYPMPNFVGLPLKLNITGLTFDGVAVVAYIRKRVHFCFLSPEDADTLFGADDTNEAGHLQSRDSLAGGINDTSYSSRRPHDSLLRDVRVESEIGRKEDGKQVLKNVGKVEKFVLEQVRRIFEEEFVYPSFWTFLV
ncbi:inheritance component mdm12 [Coccidioides immitis RMSCC 2394]|uniref:Mitochondrial distribution and morphology protein 12 n=1 Tax=Coccidioides immitis RMSCC 2394 TaxID=404692 RepID=A0A0J6YIK6_COCIT|nr:inheritance component mdm12 [Coccidioides immitis RMSCC 2394]